MINLSLEHRWLKRLTFHRMTISDLTWILSELWTPAYVGDPLICMGESGLCSRLNMPTILGIRLIGELGTQLHKKEFTPSL